MCTIRRIKTGEAALYRNVRLTSLQESPKAFSSSYDDAIARSDQSWQEQADASASGSDRVTFIVVDGATIGLAALYREEINSTVGELFQMWIAPEARGRATANALMKEICQWASCNGFFRVKAEVKAGNSRALRFYQKCGFTEAGNRATDSSSNVILSKNVE